MCVLALNLNSSARVSIFHVTEGNGGFPGGSGVKNRPADAGTRTRSLGREDPRTRKWALLGNPVDRGAWPALVHGIARLLNTTQ